MDGKHSSRYSRDFLHGVKLMSGLTFHVYQEDEVVAHNITVDDLEMLIKNNVVDVMIHDVVPVLEYEMDDASF